MDGKRKFFSYAREASVTLPPCTSALRDSRSTCDRERLTFSTNCREPLLRLRVSAVIVIQWSLCFSLQTLRCPFHVGSDRILRSLPTLLINKLVNKLELYCTRKRIGWAYFLITDQEVYNHIALNWVESRLKDTKVKQKLWKINNDFFFDISII